MTKRRRSELEENVRFIVSLALGVLALQTLVVRPFFIPSESMLPRLLVGDYLLVEKWPYGYDRWSVPFGFLPLPRGRLFGHLPRRGDVVVFRSPAPPADAGPADGTHDIIKRVIGLPGDTVQMKDGRVILNGAAVPKLRVGDFTLPESPNWHCLDRFRTVIGGQPLCRIPRYRETLPGGRSYLVLDWGPTPGADDTALFQVPAGNVFLLGDNRDDSGDSRFPPPAGMGFVPLDRLEGRAAVTFFSTDGSGSWLRPWTWWRAARPERIGEGF